MPKRKRPSIKTIKAKGDRYERELAAHITQRTGLHCERAPLSGGGVIGQLAGGADLLGTPGLHVEAKRVERLNFLEAMRQAESAIIAGNAPEAPIVINRRNNMATGESIIAMRLDAFLTLYLGWLRDEGYVKRE